MQRQSPIPLRRLKAAAPLLAALVLTVGCKEGDKEQREPEATGSPSSMRTQPPDPNPCAWVTTAEVEQLVGKLDGAPYTRAQEGGTACVYTLPDDSFKPVYTLPGTTPNREIVTIRVDFRDAMVYEAGNAMGAQLIAQDPGYRAAIAAKPIEEPPKPEGWDYFNEGAVGSVFRLGHLAVVIGVYTPRHFTGKEQTDIAIKLANLIRGRVPDLPVAAEPGDDRPSPKNPCELITRAEAEVIMGKLALEPYRSNRRTPFVKADGSSCTYYSGQHRVLVITPTWGDGRESFDLASGLSEEITSRTGLGEESADTLEGPWDQAKADPDGTLNLLAGDRLLEMKYRTAGVDVSGAVRLATIAVNRLKATQ